MRQPVALSEERQLLWRRCKDRASTGAPPRWTHERTQSVGSVGIADRISYVIGPGGKIVYAYSDRNPDKHVENTLAAVKALQKK